MRNLGHARKHCSQGGRDPYNLFKHEGLIDLLRSATFSS